MKTLITGANGMLGRRLVEVFQTQGPTHGFDLPDLDITDLEQVRRAVARVEPDWIVHAAAFTRVDEAEEKIEEVYRANAQGTRNIALATAENGSKLVYFSSDYVFDGESSRPFREWDAPAPINQYGASKLAGEFMVRSIALQHLIIRTSWLFGPDGANFVATIAAKARAGEALRVVNDQRGSPTYTVDLAGKTRELVKRGLAGTYHVTNSGDCSWFELAEAIVSAMQLEVAVVPVASSEFPTPARRPSYSVLENLMLKLDGLSPMPHWKDAVRSYLDELNV